ncbi:MAG: phosphate transport system protein [Gammaproteobacteria bacterium]|jgi:phosphate transport system protein
MDTRALGEHILHRYDEELEQLRAKVLRIGGLVETMLSDALEAVAKGDSELAATVVLADREVNALEIEIDEQCAMILARRAPVAGDLRLVIGIIKVVTDLERMGDESVRIARMAIRMAEHATTARRTENLRNLGPRVQTMLRHALDAFARTDPQSAAVVIAEDRVIDREYESLSREMITFMMEDARSIPLGLDVLFAARALERIGDRACNLCEYVIYIVRAADVRHTSIENLRTTAFTEPE